MFFYKKFTSKNRSGSWFQPEPEPGIIYTQKELETNWKRDGENAFCFIPLEGVKSFTELVEIGVKVQAPPPPDFSPKTNAYANALPEDLR